ncbi:hypothetical protein A2U01_0043595, partial [Trifolium medium]|nr:hypothetical protein [Trifolium medium]
AQSPYLWQWRPDPVRVGYSVWGLISY